MNGLFSQPVTNLDEASSKWQNLSQNLAGLQRQQALGNAALSSNQNLYSGLSALGQRGSGVGGSMERLAGSIGGTGTANAGQGTNAVMQNLAANTAKGIQSIDMPKLMGEDLAKSQKYAADVQSKSGLGGYIKSLFGG